MVATLTVLYPREEGQNFDTKRYVNEFVPMTREKYAPYGLKSWRITEFKGILRWEGGVHEDKQPPYVVQSTLVFDSKEGLQKAMDEVAGEIIQHIDKHSSHPPLMMTTHDLDSGDM